MLKLFFLPAVCIMYYMLERINVGSKVTSLNSCSRYPNGYPNRYTDIQTDIQISKADIQICVSSCSFWEFFSVSQVESVLSWVWLVNNPCSAVFHLPICAAVILFPVLFLLIYFLHPFTVVLVEFGEIAKL